MMSKSAYIRARIEPDIKAKAEAVFHELGITPSQVITMLYKQVLRKHTLPLELQLPNAKTTAAIKEARKGKALTKAKNAADLFKKLKI